MSLKTPQKVWAHNLNFHPHTHAFSELAPTSLPTNEPGTSSDGSKLGDKEAFNHSAEFPARTSSLHDDEVAARESRRPSSATDEAESLVKAGQTERTLSVRAASTVQTSLPDSTPNAIAVRERSATRHQNAKEVTPKLWEAFVRRNERVRRMRVLASDQRKLVADKRRTLKRHLLKMRRSERLEDTKDNSSDDHEIDMQGVAALFNEVEKSDDQLEKVEEDLANEEEKLIKVAPRMGQPQARRTYAVLQKYQLDHRGNDSDSNDDRDTPFETMEIDGDLDAQAAKSLALREEESRLEDEILELVRERGQIMLYVIDGPDEEAAQHGPSFDRIDEIDRRERQAKERIASIWAQRDEVLAESALEHGDDAVAAPEPRSDDEDMLSEWVKLQAGSPSGSSALGPRDSSSTTVPQNEVLESQTLG